MINQDIEKIAAIIEADAGQPIEGLVQSLKEAKAGIKGRVTTAEQIIVKTARNASGLSQSGFAGLINTPLRTLQEWEQGRTTPPGVAIRLCELIIDDPKILAA